MAAPKELRKQIRAIIKPWTKTKKKPTFSTQEMLVMCLLLHQPLSQRDVLGKFAKYFGWVRDSAAASLSKDIQKAGHGSYGSKPTGRTLRLLGRQLDDIRNDFHSPIEVHQKQHDGGILRVDVGEARVYLRSRLLPDLSKPFPFLRLPAELRLIIYEMVLCFPKSGLQIRGRAELMASTRDYNATSILANPQFRSESAPAGLSIGNMESHLALLSTSKQLYQEAMPVFYSGNNFTFRGVEAAQCRLHGTASNRIQHVRHVSFIWDPFSKVKHVEELFVLLNAMQGLRFVDIKFVQQDWEAQTHRAYNAGGTFLTAKLPGFAKLRRLCTAKKVTFYGECDALRAALKPKPKPVQLEQDKKKRGAKRKATDGGEGKDTSTEVKAKKAKKAVAKIEASVNTV